MKIVQFFVIMYLLFLNTSLTKGSDINDTIMIQPQMERIILDVTINNRTIAEIPHDQFWSLTKKEWEGIATLNSIGSMSLNPKELEELTKMFIPKRYLLLDE